MRDQTKKKKDKKEIKLPDLKIAKDPKGGYPPPCFPPPCGSRGAGSLGGKIGY